MAFESRRFLGPANTIDYQIYSKHNATEKTQELLKNSQRENGRKLNEHRKISMKTGVISRSKGSAYIELGNTKVICSVFDPREIPNKNEFSVTGELYCDFKFAPFSCKRRRSFIKELDEKRFSLNLRHSLESAVMRNEFPNFQVDICVIVIENDGSAFSTAVTCASLALADAGIPMYDLVTAVSMGLHDEMELIDPSYEEEIICSNFSERYEVSAKDNGMLTVAYMTTLKQITEIIQHGITNYKHITEYTDTLIKENEQIYYMCRQCLVRGILRNLKTKDKKKHDS